MKLSRRTIGKAMIAIGVSGIVVSLTAVVVGQSLISQMESSIDDSLVLTNEALEAVVDSITLTSAIVDTVQSGVQSVADTFDTLQSTVQQGTDLLTNSQDFLGGSLPDALEAVTNVLPTIENVASSIDSALRVLSSAPFGPNYNPEQPFDDTIADLSSALDPLPADLRTLSENFAGLTESSVDISTQLDALADDLVQLDDQLTDVSNLVDRYAATAASAKTLAEDSRADLEESARWARILLVLLGVVFALGQIVPIWLGTVLLSHHPLHTVVTHKVGDHPHEPDEPVEPLTSPPTV